ncbi:MAG: methionyl-tRNA formyltransferase [Candidatus Latescibacterota bacterium]
MSTSCEAPAILLIGSKQIGLRMLEVLATAPAGALAAVLTTDDRGDTRSRYESIGTFCARHSLPLHVAQRAQDAQRAIAQVRPDLCVVAGWYWLVDSDTLASVPLGFVGFHNSLLPRYRGGSPLVWALINGEAEVGVSMFSLSPGMDDGPVWAQGSVRVDPADQVGDLLTRLEEAAAGMLGDVLPGLLRGKVSPVHQDHSQATYCAQRLPCDGNVDWTRTSPSVHNFVRAQSDPYPGAFTYLGRRRLTIWRTRPADLTYHGTPGQVARIGPEGVYVICGGSTAVVVEEVELGGKRGDANRIITSTRARFRPVREPRRSG